MNFSLNYFWLNFSCVCVCVCDLCVCVWERFEYVCVCERFEYVCVCLWFVCAFVWAVRMMIFWRKHLSMRYNNTRQREREERERRERERERERRKWQRERRERERRERVFVVPFLMQKKTWELTRRRKRSNRNILWEKEQKAIL